MNDLEKEIDESFLDTFIYTNKITSKLLLRELRDFLAASNQRCYEAGKEERDNEPIKKGSHMDNLLTQEYERGRQAVLKELMKEWPDEATEEETIVGYGAPYEDGYNEMNRTGLDLIKSKKTL
jgi:hypothetical protein